MRQLNFDLLRLLEGDRQGSHGTRRMRRYVLMQAAETLHRLGYGGLRAKGLKGRHVEALAAERQRQGLGAGTMRNRMAHPALVGGQGRQGGHRAQGQRELRDRDERALTGAGPAPGVGETVRRFPNWHTAVARGRRRDKPANTPRSPAGQCRQRRRGAPAVQESASAISATPCLANRSLRASPRSA